MINFASIHELYAMPYPGYELYCIYSTTSKVFPYLENHKLPTVVKHLEFDFKGHFNALADAEASEEIAKMII